MKLRNLFLPHPQTHQKAHLLSINALAVYIGIFIVLQMVLRLAAVVKPEVLGVSSNITAKKIIELTNLQRDKLGLGPLSEDARLSTAALKKAKNMFEENYWAHYSPSGKDPWGFILRSGYKFTHAGENLARNFYTSGETVDAWMASPTHRENIVNPKYKNIGVGVLEGTLNGEPTILIVQEFGTPVDLAQLSFNNEPSFEGSENLTPVNPQLSGVTTSKKISIDPYLISKQIGFFIILMIGLLLILDWVVLKKRAVVRVGFRHMPHLAVLALGISIIANTRLGEVL